MSLQSFLEAPERFSNKFSKPALEESLKNISAIPTRSNTPENEKNYSDSYSDRDSTSGSLTPKGRALSSSSSMNSIDLPEGNSFEIDVCPKRKRFSNHEERRQFVEEYKRKFKTEMCKNWELKGRCKFGNQCCFAHGRHELKAKVLTHVKYKTKPCKQYHQIGYCPYGQRCQYLHKEALKPNIFFVPTEEALTSDYKCYTYDLLQEINKMCNNNEEIEKILEKLPKRPRLQVFQDIAMSA